MVLVPLHNVHQGIYRSNRIQVRVFLLRESQYILFSLYVSGVASYVDLDPSATWQHAMTVSIWVKPERFADFIGSADSGFTNVNLGYRYNGGFHVNFAYYDTAIQQSV